MIDDPATVKRLMKQMEAHLPIAAFPAGPLAGLLRSKGLKVKADRALLIKRVFNAGDDGGLCATSRRSLTKKRLSPSRSRTYGSLRATRSTTTFALTSESEKSGSPSQDGSARARSSLDLSVSLIGVMLGSTGRSK